MTLDKSQLMRGTLQGCILKIISKRMTYGYEILEILRSGGFDGLSEGTVYPLLQRMEKQGALRAKMLPSPMGPRRKYYELTEEGREYLCLFEEYWLKLHRTVNRIMRASIKRRLVCRRVRR